MPFPGTRWKTEHVARPDDGGAWDATVRAVEVRTDLGQLLLPEDEEVDVLSEDEPTTLCASDLKPGMRIVVVRVTEKLIAEPQPIPYSRKIIHDEALPAGESRLIQSGEEGVEEFTYRIIYEDGVEISRTLIKRTTTTAPVEEISTNAAHSLLALVLL